MSDLIQAILDVVDDEVTITISGVNKKIGFIEIIVQCFTRNKGTICRKRCIDINTRSKIGFEKELEYAIRKSKREIEILYGDDANE